MAKRTVVKVKDEPNLARVDNSALIINLDQEGYHSYIEHRNKVLEEKEKITNLENQVEELTKLVSKLLKGKSDV